MTQIFRTVKVSAEGYFAKNSSKFYSTAFHVIKLEEIKYILKQLKEEHPNAVHICYAYRIIESDRLDEFSTDAGEPNGSSGLPILNELKKQNIVNAAIFVIRYYGGTKLGIPGLIEAYGTAAKNCLENADMEKWTQKEQLKLEFPYNLQRTLDSIMSKTAAEIIQKSFDEKVKIQIKLEVEQKKIFMKMIDEKGGGKIIII